MSPRLTLVPKAVEGGIPDEALCQAFLDGDEQAFSELVRRYQEQVFRLVRRYGCTRDDALDLTQRAFMQAFEAAKRALPKLVSAPAGSFRAWLFRISLNLAKNQRRDAQRWSKTELEKADPSALALAPVGSEQVEKEQQLLATRAVVESLPPRQKEVFALRIDGGLSFAQVGEALGITENNAKVHFHYAMKKLRDVFDAATW